MKTAKIVSKLLKVNSRTANRILRKEWEATYLPMADWHSQLNELFHRWLDWNGIEAPVGYIDSGVNPEWTALMERYLKEEGDYTAEQEAFILGFWGREVGLDPKWVGNEVKMIKWMLNIR